MKNISRISVLYLFVFFLVFSVNPAICFSESAIKIKNVKRLPKGKFISNEHQALIGAKYNQKFYNEADEDNKNIVFVVKLVNKSLQPYAVYLFYKTPLKKELQKQIVTVKEPLKKSEAVKFFMPNAQLKSEGYPDFWWVEVRNLSGDEVLDEKGIKHYKVIKERLKLAEKS